MADEQKRGIGPLRSVPGEFRRRGYRHTASWACHGAFFAIVVGLGPFVIRQLGGSAFQCLAVNLGQAVPLVFALLWAPFLERRNPVRLTGLLLGLGGALIMLSGLTRDVWPLVVVLTAGMLLVSLSNPILGVSLRQIYPDRWRGKLISLPTTVHMAARILCMVVAGRLLRADIALYRTVFPAAGACLLLGGLLFRRIRGSRGRRGGPQGDTVLQQMRASVRGTVGNKALLGFLIGYFVTTCGGVMHGNALPIFANDELGLTTAQWGYAGAAAMAAIVVSSFLWGALMDRIGAPATVLVSWCLLGASFLAMFFVRTWAAFLCISVVQGLAMAGNLVAFFPVVMHFTPASETMRGMALHATLWGVRWVTMVSLVIWVIDRQVVPMRWLFLVSAALAIVGTVVMAVVWRTHREQAAATGAGSVCGASGA